MPKDVGRNRRTSKRVSAASADKRPASRRARSSAKDTDLALEDVAIELAKRREKPPTSNPTDVAYEADELEEIRRKEALDERPGPRPVPRAIRRAARPETLEDYDLAFATLGLSAVVCDDLKEWVRDNLAALGKVLWFLRRLRSDIETAQGLIELRNEVLGIPRRGDRGARFPEEFGEVQIWQKAIDDFLQGAKLTTTAIGLLLELNCSEFHTRHTGIEAMAETLEDLSVSLTKIADDVSEGEFDHGLEGQRNRGRNSRLFVRLLGDTYRTARRREIQSVFADLLASLESSRKRSDAMRLARQTIDEGLIDRWMDKRWSISRLVAVGKHGNG